MSELAYATSTSEEIMPIVDKLQSVLVGEDFESCVIAVLMLAIVMQRQDLDPDSLQSIMDEWSKTLHDLFALYDAVPNVPVLDRKKLN